MQPNNRFANGYVAHNKQLYLEIKEKNNKYIYMYIYVNERNPCPLKVFFFK